MVFVRNKLKVNIHIKELSIIIFSSLCMLIPINLVISNLTNSFISSIIQIVVGVSTYVILLYVFKAPLFMEILNRFLKRGVDNET